MTRRRLSALIGGVVLTAAVFGLAGAGAAMLLRAPAAAPQLPPAAAAAPEQHLPFGPVRPARPLPDMAVTLDDGSAATLSSLVAGRWTLVQLMFAGCTTTCPVQGAIFEEAQRLAGAAGTAVPMLSLTIDPIGDRPAALADWLASFNAGDGWRAAIPDPVHLGALLDALEGRSDGIDLHDARVYLIDPKGRLAFASEPMPDPRALIDLIASAKAAPST